MKHFSHRMAQRAFLWISAIVLVLMLAGINSLNALAEDTSALTTTRQDIPVAELNWLLKPLTVDQLEVEVNAWGQLLQAKSMEISELNIALLQIKAEQKERAEQQDEEQSKVDPTEAEIKKKESIIEQLTELAGERTNLHKLAQTAVDAFEAKGGDAAKVTTYRKYLEVAGGVTVDASDTEAVIAYVKNWLTSADGGLHWLGNISKFAITVIAFYFLSCLLSRATRHALNKTKATSELMRNFLIASVRRVIIFVGVIVGLAALEVDIGPLLAAIGAAGFVIAFALQNSLANFASGILIMMFRPFDVKDIVEVAGVTGTVKSVSLLSTQMTTFDNKALVIPNNEVWSGVITNYTATGKRRVDMVFGIGYDDDIDKAQKVIEEIVTSHKMVLKDPEPVVRVHELADSSVNFIVRPWTYSDDYWDVFWDITHQVKKRLDEEGISIPFPQRDVHVYNAALPASPVDSNKKADDSQSQNKPDIIKRTDRTAIDHSDADDGD